MDWLKKHKKRHNVSGENIREAYENHTSLYIGQNIKDSPTYKEVIINGEKIDARMVTEKKHSVASGYDVMKLLYEPYFVPKNGQLVYIDNEVWLTVYANSKKLSPYNFIRKCTHSIEVALGEEKTLQPCVLETRIRNTQKLLELEYVDLSLDSLKITVPYNNATKTIKEKDRFVIEGLAWEVQGFNRITHVENGEGFIELATKKIPLNSKELEDLKAEDSTDPTQVRITIEGKDKVKQKGKEKYVAIVTYDNKIVEGGEVLWEVNEGQITQEGLFIATCNTGDFLIKASYEYIDGCGEEKKIEATKKIQVYNNGEWW